MPPTPSPRARLLLVAGCALAVALTWTPRAGADTVHLDISSVPDALLHFDGGTDGLAPGASGVHGSFYFGDTLPEGADVGPATFQIDGASHEGAVDLYGLILAPVGGFQIVGPISSVGGTTLTLEEGQVAGDGDLWIYDGWGGRLTARITWSVISTTTGESATGGLMRMGANLTNIAYEPLGASSNLVLAAMAAAGSGDNVLSFEFDPATSLSQLVADNTTTATAFSGDINTRDTDTSVIPEPASLALAAAGLCTLLARAGSRRRR